MTKIGVRNTGKFNIYLVTVAGRKVRLRPNQTAYIWQNDEHRIIRAVLRSE